MRTDYKHYQNRGQPGDRIFVTTTVLDFVEVFKDPYLAELAAQQLFDAHSSTGAALHAFVVMSRHLHFHPSASPDAEGLVPKLHFHPSTACCSSVNYLLLMVRTDAAVGAARSMRVLVKIALRTPKSKQYLRQEGSHWELGVDQ